MTLNPTTALEPARPGLAMLAAVAGMGGLVAGTAAVSEWVPGPISGALPAASASSQALVVAAFCGVLLVWGIGPAWASGQLLRRPGFAVLLPVWSAALGLVCWWLSEAGVSLVAGAGADVGQRDAARGIVLCSIIVLVLTLASVLVAAAFTMPWRTAARCVLPLLLIGAPWIALGAAAFLYVSDTGAGRLVRPEPWSDKGVLLVGVLAAGLNGAAIGHVLRKATARRVLAAVLITCVCAAGWPVLHLILAPDAGSLAGPSSAALAFLGVGGEAASGEEQASGQWCLAYLAAVLVLGWGQWIGLLLGTYEIQAAGAGNPAADLARVPGSPRRGGAPMGRVYLWLTLLYAAFIIYGSLVPLHFHEKALPGAWGEFLDRMSPEALVVSRSDFVANILLGVPLGFFGMGFLTRENRSRHPWAAAIAIIAGTSVLAALVEFGQLYVPERTTSLSDIIAQTLGASIGVGVWFMGGGHVSRYVRGLWGEYIQDEDALKILGGYALLYAVYQLLPFNITIRPAEMYHKFLDGMVTLIPFTDRASLTAYLFLSQAAVMIPIGYAVVVLGRGRGRPVVRATIGGALFAGALEFLQLFILPRYSSTTDVVMGALGAAVGGWLAISFGPASRPALTRTPFWASRGGIIKWAMLLAWLGGLAWHRWQPFAFEWPREGLWQHATDVVCVPLTTFYYQSELGATAGVARGFITFVLLGLLLRSALAPAGPPRRAAGLPAMLAAVGIAIGLEAAQLLLPQRGIDPATLLIQAAGGIVGVLLYARFVRTFVVGPEEDEAAIPWSTT
ncbi:MAG TPA: VanZ family protein [Phycisphaerae bacterium]|nr:VanZ family protein [Phycisphaerae bacterium]